MPQLLKKNFVLKRETNKFKSPLNAKKKIQNILEKDSRDIPEQITKLVKNKKSRIIAGSNLLSSFTEIKDDDSELPLSQRMNEPVVKDAYIKFVQHLSQQSSLNEETLRSTPQLSHKETDKSIDFSTFGTENGSIQESQLKMSIDSGISLSQNILNDKQVKRAYLQNRILDGEELDFMKNFKPTKKKLRVFPSYSEEVDNAIENKKNKTVPRKNNKPAPDRSKKIWIKKEKPAKKIRPMKNTEKTSKISKPFEQQPLSLYEKMILIHKSRDVGLYVLCDHCDKSRYLPHIKDPLDLPEKWYCSMNPEKNHDNCADPEEEVAKEDKDYLIENEYNSGSIVWARLEGYPWWPAMVEDDPDYEQYYWLEGSLKPVSYHVTFFDSREVTRAWLSPISLKPFKINMESTDFKPGKSHKFKARIEIAFTQAIEAVNLPLIDRLRKYSFIERYPKGLKDLETQTKKGKTKHNENKINRKPQGKRLRKIISSISWNAADANITDTLNNMNDEKIMNMSLDLLDQDFF